ncbi:hypothetical protein DICSQDRAFT_89378 [Dichomitus squalens LYAD-421 SS1]|uniref:Heterokaryon incompatibility domain-containing protein n=1 Tax=Dichomitus squalens (strain LYAD-421) TaxID=732165 RepID=R7SU87_DICSQ|nr:uncharacterized protein DICSQDRAFT_89378 [Dichomitus squalens LYAD-421 SS1]EJF59310.1 hypothetical protein DICSQDRAFT_89378 [Dichomitus squalens LYAD-421 SS1]
MRLLDTRTGLFVFVHDPRKIRYAIVSHTWDPIGEQTYQDVLEVHKHYKDIFANDPSRSSDDDGTEAQPDPVYNSMTTSEMSGNEPELTAQAALDDSKSEEGGCQFNHGTDSTASGDRLENTTFEESAKDPDLADDNPSMDDVPFSTSTPTSSTEPMPDSDTSQADSDSHNFKFGDPPIIPDMDALLNNGRTVLRDPRLSVKVRRSCLTARLDGFTLLWLDSCCIDKASSAELSEAINSMYEWYELSTICYSYLADVPDDDIPEAPESYFRKSRLHTRGWTLQELIAPRYNVFLSGPNWRVLGTKLTLAHVLEEITGIDVEVLTHQKPVDAVGIAKRMWWASKRETTRIEDEAYSLMGIFGVNMPTVYGEGRNAFIRLQEEILKHTPYDQSLFAWGPCWRFGEGLEPDPVPVRGGWAVRRVLGNRDWFVDMYGLLAGSPKDFACSANVEGVVHSWFMKQLGLKSSTAGRPEYHLSFDIRTRLPIISAKAIKPFLPPDSVRNLDFDMLAILECADTSSAHFIALPLRREQGKEPEDDPLMVGATAEGGRSQDTFYRMFALSIDVLQHCSRHIAVEDVRVLGRPRNVRIDGLGILDSVSGPLRSHFAFFQITPEYWCIPLLARHGFALARAHQKYIPALEFYLTRAGDEFLERIIVRIHVTPTDLSSNHFREVERFSVCYKIAHAKGGPLAPVYIGDLHLGDLPILEDLPCIEVSNRFQQLSTNPKWAVFELHGPTQDTVRTLRISFRWGELGAPSELMRARVAVELSEPYVPKKKFEGPTIDSNYIPIKPHKDRLVREQQARQDGLLIGMWKHWVTDHCAHGPDDVFSRSAVLIDLVGAEDEAGTGRMPWELW